MRIIALISLSLLAACASGNVQDTLGLNRKAPDAFRVVSRPALSVPPGFDLRPPEPGAPPRAAGSTEDMARDALLSPSSIAGTETLDDFTASGVPSAYMPVISGPTVSSGEASFLDKAGTKVAEEDIRQQLYREQAVMEEVVDESASPLERWFGLGGDNGEVVDAAAEAERIRSNKDEGKSITEGEIPTQNKTKGGVLNRLFE